MIDRQRLGQVFLALQIFILEVVANEDSIYTQPAELVLAGKQSDSMYPYQMSLTRSKRQCCSMCNMGAGDCGCGGCPMMSRQIVASPEPVCPARCMPMCTSACVMGIDISARPTCMAACMPDCRPQCVEALEIRVSEQTCIQPCMPQCSPQCVQALQVKSTTCVQPCMPSCNAQCVQAVTCSTCTNNCPSSCTQLTCIPECMPRCLPQCLQQISVVPTNTCDSACMPSCSRTCVQMIGQCPQQCRPMCTSACVNALSIPATQGSCAQSFLGGISLKKRKEEKKDPESKKTN
ncbi:unnamed protein product, partial [Mesorhabditis spiculigera]